jgi:ABC-type branched-subunit amino acid transport system substrate-binding protein
MVKNRLWAPRAGAGLLVVAALLGGVLSAGNAQAARSVRGFDGSTVKLAGIGWLSSFPGAPTGVEARVKRFNDTNEIKGIQLEFTEYVDDKQDPATSLAESRRLVTQNQVFAIVGDLSATDAGDYLNQQHVPYFGAGYNATYCSTTKKPDTTLYGFAIVGCSVPPNPGSLPGTYDNVYKYVSKQTGKKHPTIALFGDDGGASKIGVTNAVSMATGSGFTVVYNGAPMTSGAVSDYTPAAQTVLHSDNGNAPDAMNCLSGFNCIGMYSAMKANAYTGTFLSVLYSDLLVKAMAGSAVYNQFNNLGETTPGITQMKTDVQAVKPDATVDGGTVNGYASTDMFIQALKTVAKKGKGNITPENVQKAAMHQTWAINGLAGPIAYPQSTAHSYPACTAVSVSDGTAWTVVAPYSCSKKTYPVVKQ